MRYGETFHLRNILEDGFGLDWLAVFGMDFCEGTILAALGEGEWGGGGCGKREQPTLGVRMGRYGNLVKFCYALSISARECTRRYPHKSRLIPS